MLTLTEIESTMQIEYELQLEALGEPALRQRLDEPARLRERAPRHLSDDDLCAIAERTLAEMVARRTAPAQEPDAPEAPGTPWILPPYFTWFAPRA